MGFTGPKQLFPADGFATVDDTATNDIGAVGFDADGNEYVYLQGVASTILGSWVTFDEDGVTTLIVANAVGRVAVSMAAILATKYGWYQVKGKNTAASSDATVADKALYIDGTAGRVDDAAVAGDWVSGAISRSVSAANLITVELNYPMVYDGGYLT